MCAAHYPLSSPQQSFIRAREHTHKTAGFDGEESLKKFHSECAIETFLSPPRVVHNNIVYIIKYPYVCANVYFSNRRTKRDPVGLIEVFDVSNA